jgi:hypothetical protein
MVLSWLIAFFRNDLLKILFGVIPTLINCFFPELLVEIVFVVFTSFDIWDCFDPINHETNSICESVFAPASATWTLAGATTSVFDSCANIPTEENNMNANKKKIFLCDVVLACWKFVFMSCFLIHVKTTPLAEP